MINLSQIVPVVSEKKWKYKAERERKRKTVKIKHKVHDWKENDQLNPTKL